MALIFRKRKQITIKDSLGVGKHALLRGFLTTAQLLLLFVVVICLTLIYSVSPKNPPLRFSDIFFPNGWEFLINFDIPIIRCYVR